MKKKDGTLKKKFRSSIQSISDMKTELDTMFPHFSDIDINDSTNLERLQEVFNDILNLNEQIDDFYFRRDLKKKKFKKIAVAASLSALSSCLFILIRNGFAFQKDLYLWTGIVAAAFVIDV